MLIKSFGLRWRKTKRVLIIAILFLLIVGGLYSGHVIKDILHDMTCSEEESHNVLAEYCQMYADGRIVGDLCPSLCVDKNIKYKHCTNYRRGKRVFIVSCRNFCVGGETVNAVLKTRHKNFSDFMNEAFSFEREDKNEEGPPLELLKTMINDVLRLDLEIELPSDTDPISYIWQDNYMEYYNKMDRHSQFAVGRSILSLIRQSEYLMVKVNQDQLFFPHIYGTCGPLYLVEFAPPGEMLEHDVQITNYPWLERAKLAKNILEIVRSMDEAMREPLHYCDVKGENFGVSGLNKIKLIDTDTAFFHKKMLHELSADNCTRNSDCDFFDCQGWCNVEIKHCEKIRINSNLQSVCQDVFLGRLMDTFGGLLRNPPRAIKAQLKSILDKCAYGQTSENGIPVQKPTEEIYWRLYTILQNSIDSQD